MGTNFLFWIFIFLFLIIYLFLESGSLLSMVILMESFLVVFLSYMLLFFGLYISIESFFVLYICILIVESGLSLIVSLGLIKKNYDDMMDFMSF